ncbi:YTH domain-containing protein ECT1-like isoform X4 [Telopea speciosissima]|uniref:YTH domain-containing protein ECT1-like isoform X4 n=1 Tax=Telopea speciosissima TaxID=54955 RepID=UPI001CC577E7|nr:YTH domain-containing protein ECT1-like isoform X4 [Telopea speciosissima]
MAAVQQESDRIISGGDSTESMNVLTLNAEGKPADPNNLKEQSLSTKGERMVPSNPSQDAAPTGAPRFATGQSASLGAARDHSTVYQPNIYAPQAHSFYYGGYDNGTGEWDEYPHYVNAEGLEIGSPTSQQQGPLYGFGSGSSSYTRGYPNGGIYQGSSFEGGSLSSLGTNSRSWMAIEKGRRRGRRTGSLCVCNETLDVLDEQNRGPRASKLKSQITAEHGSSVDCGKNNISKVDTHSESYNRPDFVTEYGDAKFFIIKSYSEDNVHKSIKYGVWASTPNGNRKLDAAYCEAKERKGDCPVFLFFSVNASAQFCGVAAMAGPVDFDKSVDYWQQDKWSGQFPVKWHLIKDVPNSQFRHIILENNDNKPVTNSRDTQEVKMEQGIEMLNIFKCYETDMSILDDFDFYEDREKAMLDRKARQQSSLMVTPVAGAHEHRNPVSLSNNFIKQMSKSFAQAVKLDEVCKKDLTTEKNESAVTVSMSMVVKPEDTKTSMTLAASTAQSS